MAIEISRNCIPYTPFRGQLEESRICLVSNAGVYIQGEQEAFNLKGDLTTRKIPSDIDSRRLAIAHEHYDHTDADRDVNLVFPIDRLRELVSEKKIKSVTAEFISKGYSQAMREIKERVSWEIAKAVDRMRPDIVLLTAG
ncbi:MAG: hypothetical protein HYR55_07365 [Acidobacteria bacterium]|nr:hypothetical protein [Acidobacteriota bacterium]